MRSGHELPTPAEPKRYAPRMNIGPLGVKLKSEAIQPPKTHSCQSILVLQFRESVLRAIIGCIQLDFGLLGKPLGNGRLRYALTEH